MQGSLPDFLDLSSDVESPQPRQLTHKIPPLRDVLHFPTSDERPVAVQEGTLTSLSRVRNPKRFGGDGAAPVLAEPPTSTRLVPRRVQSAAELASGRVVSAPTVALDRGSSKPGTRDGDLKRSDSFGRHFPTQVLSAHAAAFRAEVTREGSARRGYNARTDPVAEYEGGHTHSRSVVESTDYWRGESHYNKLVQDFRNTDATNPKRGGGDANSPHVQRNRMMSPQDVVGPVSSAFGRPRASSAATSPLSPHRHENRYRTLGDRAYHHPDVPRTPLFSEHNYDPSSWTPGGIVRKPCGPSTGRDSDIDNRFVSSPETESTFPSPRSDKSQNSLSPGPRPARLRLRAPSVSRGDESPPSRESYVPTHACRPGSSSPDLPRGHSLHIGRPPAPSLGVGLSTIDNGAFEAPRPAPTPAPATGPRSRTREQGHPPVAWRRKNSLRIRTGNADEEGSEKGSPVFRRPLRSLSLTRKGSTATLPAPADPRVVRSASPVVGFGAISFRWQIWSKVQRPLERSDTPVGRLRAAGKSEPDIKTSFIETETKPQRKGLLFRKKP
jgi:hypothetical protein